jgi:hypothetical protein
LGELRREVQGGESLSSGGYAAAFQQVIGEEADVGGDAVAGDVGRGGWRRGRATEEQGQQGDRGEATHRKEGSMEVMGR